jgi:hypothetical protein
LKYFIILKIIFVCAYATEFYISKFLFMSVVLVLNCDSRCNTKKADRTPEEAKMNMAHKPYIPSLIEENYMVKSMWDDFQRSFL